MKASALESVQRILFGKDQKDVDYFLMGSKVHGMNTEVTFKVWLQAMCSF